MHTHLINSYFNSKKCNSLTIAKFKKSWGLPAIMSEMMTFSHLKEYKTTHSQPTDKE